MFGSQLRAIRLSRVHGPHIGLHHPASSRVLPHKVLRSKLPVFLEQRIGDMATVHTLQPIVFPSTTRVIAPHERHGNEEPLAAFACTMSPRYDHLLTCYEEIDQLPWFPS